MTSYFIYRKKEIPLATLLENELENKIYECIENFSVDYYYNNNKRMLATASLKAASN